MGQAEKLRRQPLTSRESISNTLNCCMGNRWYGTMVEAGIENSAGE